MSCPQCDQKDRERAIEHVRQAEQEGLVTKAQADAFERAFRRKNRPGGKKPLRRHTEEPPE